MDFYGEQQARIDKQASQLGQLAYEKHQIQTKINQMTARITDIETNISDLEVSIMTAQQTQRDFNSYLAVKEGAVTLEQIKEGIENGDK